MSFSKAHLSPYNQLTTQRFHIQFLALYKIAYLQEKVITASVPIQPQIFTETPQVVLMKYLPSYIRRKSIFELIIINVSVSYVFCNVEIAPKFPVNHNKSLKLYFEPQLFTQQKNSSHREIFDKISFQNKVLHPNTAEMKLEK